MLYTRIQFPNIQLRRRDGHKLRGYFGRVFQEHSPLLHNHFEDGTFRYAYPQVQYKVIGKTPQLIGLGEGSHLLTQLFLQMDELRIDEQVYPISHKQIQSESFELSIRDELVEYAFVNPWMGLNQQNYRHYQQLAAVDKPSFLQTRLRNHMVVLLKAFEADLSKQILVKAYLRETPIEFKNQRMIGFSGRFITNVQLPEAIGLGKSVARGFGAITRNPD